MSDTHISLGDRVKLFVDGRLRTNACVLMAIPTSPNETWIFSGTADTRIIVPCSSLVQMEKVEC